MAYLDMYGRRADQEATFDYPSTQLPLKRVGKLYIELPAAANRIFGVPQSRNRNADQTVVQLDPTSTYEYRSFNPSDDTPPAIGLGGFGRKKRRLSGLGAVKTFKDKHPHVENTFSSLDTIMKDSAPTVITVVVLGAITLLSAFSFLGKFAPGR